MSRSDLLKIMEEEGALLSGHFMLSSGRHSPGYLQCARLLQDPVRATVVGCDLARAVNGLLPADGVDAVAGPALGGVIISHEVGRWLGVRAVFAERSGGELMFRRGFALEPGERVLVVEDVVTTGGSLRELIALVREAGAVPVAAAAIVDRRIGDVDLGMPLVSLVSIEIPTYTAEECPLCRDGVPIDKPGSRPGR